MALTRDEMVKIVNDGKSFLHGEGPHRRIISREQDIPSDVEIAGNDKGQLAAAREALMARRDAITAEIAAIDAKPTVVSPAVETPDTPEQTAAKKAKG